MISGSYSSQGGYYNHDGVNSYYSEGSSDNSESELNRALLHANEDGEAFVEVIRFSVKRGFDPYDEDEECVDAYDIAANKGYTQTLYKLLTIESLKGADSDAIGAAVMNFNKETQSIIKLLLEHEVIPNPMLAQKSSLIAGTRLANTPSYPQTAIHWLIEAASIISSKKDWDRGLYSHEEKTELHKSAIECVEMILNVEYSDVDPNALCKSPKPQTLLTYALVYGEIEIAKILLAQSSINPYKLGTYGNTANCIDNGTINITEDEIRELLNAIRRHEEYPSVNENLRKFQKYLESKLPNPRESYPSIGSEDTSSLDDM